jgi:hypothetical protein
MAAFVRAYRKAACPLPTAKPSLISAPAYRNVNPANFPHAARPATELLENAKPRIRCGPTALQNERPPLRGRGARADQRSSRRRVAAANPGNRGEIPSSPAAITVVLISHRTCREYERRRLFTRPQRTRIAPGERLVVDRQVKPLIAQANRRAVVLRIERDPSLKP